MPAAASTNTASSLCAAHHPRMGQHGTIEWRRVRAWGVRGGGQWVGRQRVERRLVAAQPPCADRWATAPTAGAFPSRPGLRVTLIPHCLHHLELLLRRALAAGNDGAGVAHALARRRRDARDEADDRLLHVLLRPARGGFLVGAPDLADHHDRVGIRIVVEQAQHVDVLETVDRVAADADRASTGRDRGRSAARPPRR